MSKKEIIAYAITHAPRGVKGGPYEGGGAQTVALLRDAWRIGPYFREYARAARGIVQHRVPTARVIRIVRKARPSPCPRAWATAEDACDDVEVLLRENARLRAVIASARALIAAPHHSIAEELAYTALDAALAALEAP